MKTLVIAVSGGIDSVVLLDTLLKRGHHKLIVAHFDHGIRPESDADARFVRGLSEKHGLIFEAKREELGPNASEDTARIRRYEFLRDVAKKHSGVIATAHHLDDVIETIAINLHRGTGWRGLAVFGGGKIERPLIDMTKKDIREYASKHDLEWVEDETNGTDAYLRNRLRSEINSKVSSVDKLRLVELWRAQLLTRRDLEAEAVKILQAATRDRHFFTQIDEASGQELLWTLLNESNVSVLRSQRRRLLHAIKTAKPGSVLEVGSGVNVRFSARSFIVETP
ncbi:MAG: tRNA lysidine(34) synthetase TilS [Candidatus Saccharibacteria bacterium]